MRCCCGFLLLLLFLLDLNEVPSLIEQSKYSRLSVYYKMKSGDGQVLVCVST